MNVSIIIPAYNAASTVADTLESVLAQTFQGWEAIVVDDGSTDGTGEVVREFTARDGRIKVVAQPNGGESAARNTGVGLASYDWLHFLDADDWIAPTCLERLTAELAANPELDAVHCRGVRVAQDGTFLGDDYVVPVGDLFPTLARRAAFPVHACVVRRSLVEAVGRFDTTLKTSPDWDLWQRIARGGARFGGVNEVLVYYRMTANSSSLNAEQLFSDILTVLRRGHAPDSRVANPLPEYAEGWKGSTVESQVFYLLSWCAGLLIGRGGDARGLFESIPNDRYAGLYPPAIAQSLFQAATLPSCKTPPYWEILWPQVHTHAEAFLVALEARSGTPELARLALRELKKLILKHSATWAAVIAEEQRERARLEDDLEGMRRVAHLLQQEKTASEGRHEHAKGLAASLEHEKALLTAELGVWKHLSHQSEQEKASLTTALGAWKHQTIQLEQEKTALEDRQQHAQRLAESLEHEKSSLTGELSVWKHLSRQLEQEKALLTADLGVSKHRADQLEQARTALEDQHEQAKRLTESLEHEKSSLAGELGVWKQLARQLEQEKAFLTTESGDWKRRAHQWEQEKTTFEDRHEHAKRLTESLEQEKSSLTGELGVWRPLAQQLEQEKSSLTAELSLWKHLAHQLEQEKATFEERREHAQRMTASLEQENSSLAGELGVWRPLAQQLEQEKSSLTAEVSVWRHLTHQLEQEKAALEDRHEYARRRIESLEHEKTSSAAHMSAWKRLAEQRESATAEVRSSTWIQVGGRLGILRAPELASDGLEKNGHFDSPPLTNTATLRTDGGSSANLLLPCSNPEVIRIAIETITTKTPWDVQLNLPNLKVKANQRYTVRFRARSDEPRSVMLGLAKNYEPWTSLGLYKKIDLTSRWQSFQEEFEAVADDERARIHFDAGERDIAIEICAVRFLASAAR